MFYNELDLLDIRLNELNSVVDYFVLIEAEKSHQNKTKKMYFLENKERYKDFLDKIIHIIVPSSEFTNDPWYNENLQRRKILEGISNAHDDDIILISDLDEIISSNSLNTLKENYDGTPSVFDQKIYFWYLNTRAKNYKWRNAGISTKKFVIEHGTQLFKSNKTSHLFKVIENGGWHFTYIGNEVSIKNKLDNFAHTEFSHLSENHLKMFREKLIDPLGRTNEGIELIIDPITTLPKYLQENIEKFKDYIRI
jgi:hypothetical protein